MSAKSKSIYALYDESGSSFLKHLKASRNPDDKKIHKLRVDVKNIRAFLELLGVLTRNASRHKRLRRLLSPVFKRAGEVRTASLNLRLIKDKHSKGFAAFRYELEKSRTESGKKFKEELNAFDKNAFRQRQQHILKKIRVFRKKNTEQAIHSYIKSLCLSISALLPAYGDDRVFHEVRKKFKSIKTLTKLLIHLSPSAANKNQLGRIAAVEERIGKWHDRIVLTEHLEDFIHQRQSLKGLQTLSHYIVRLKKNNSSTKERIAKQLKVKLF